MRDIRADAVAILRAAIDAAQPGPLVERALADANDIDAAAHIFLLAMGKAAVPMAEAAQRVLGARITRSLVIAPHGARSETLRVMHAAHPLPDASSVRAAHAAELLLAHANEGDLVLVLISGGASALVAAPEHGITIEQYAACVRDLLHAGADIHELNIVRQHIDSLKGGRMAALAAPAKVLGLVLSDVVGDPLDIIASGPLTPATATPRDAAAVLRKRGVEPMPLLCDTPRTDNAHVRIIGSNAIARAGAGAHARALGYQTEVLEAPVTGEARDAGRAFARTALARRDRAPFCLLAGGETTVTVAGAGIGGRNQEFALAAALELDGVPEVAIGSIGTDGIDGPTAAAGAIADGSIDVDAAETALLNNDAYTFFREHGGLIITGPTGTNVMDVMVAVIAG